MIPEQDGHLHTEWSWDAAAGSMEATCARAVELGLRSVAFTEHAEFSPFVVRAGYTGERREHFRDLVGPDRVLRPPGLNVAGYLGCVQRCRERFPGLRILSGVELSEPHRHPDGVAALLGGADFDRVLGSVHAVHVDGEPEFVDDLFRRLPPERVLRHYLAEALRLARSSADFDVLAHVDFPVRSWPAGRAAYRPEDFEDETREVLSALAGSGRALEVNTKVPLHSTVVRWWREAGGAAVSFGSDAHHPAALARGLADAAAMVESHGFGPGSDPTAFWTASRPR